MLSRPRLGLAALAIAMTPALIWAPRASANHIPGATYTGTTSANGMVDSSADPLR